MHIVKKDCGLSNFVKAFIFKISHFQMDCLLSTVEDALAQAEADYAADKSVPGKSALQAWRAARACVQAAMDVDRTCTYVQFQLCGHRTAQCRGHVSHGALIEVLPTLRQLTTQTFVV